MATNFPSSADSFTNPTSGDTLDNPPHDQQHANINDAMEAVQASLLDGAPLRIDSGGDRVGVNNATPTYTVDVSSADGAALRLSETSNDPATAVLAHADGSYWALSTGGSNVSEVANGELSFYDGAASAHRMLIDENGNVGIGTTSPAGTLDVNGKIHLAGGTNRYIEHRSGNNDILYSSDAGDFYRQDIANSSHQFFTGNIERLMIDSSGRVGIGTSSPASTLHVNGEVQITGNNTNLKGSGNYPNALNFYHPTTGFWHQSGPRLLEGSRMAWYWNNGTGYTEAASLTTDGTLSGVSVGKTDTNRYTYITAWPNDGNWVAVNGGNGYLLLDGNYSDSSIYLRSYNSGGLVRIGSGHQNTLSVGSNYADVAGYLYASDHVNSNGQIRSAGVYNSTTPATTQMVHIADANYQYRMWRSTSRRDAKTDIESITDDNAKALLSSRPVWFRSAMPHDDPNLSYYGFIAEELAEVDPRMCTWSAGRVLREGDELQEGERACVCENNQEFVHTFDHQPECIQVTGVDYSRLTAHLTKLAQLQDATIQDLVTRIEVLETT